MTPPPSLDFVTSEPTGSKLRSETDLKCVASVFRRRFQPEIRCVRVQDLCKNEPGFARPSDAQQMKDPCMVLLEFVLHPRIFINARVETTNEPTYTFTSATQLASSPGSIRSKYLIAFRFSALR
jgi:hypothetical protein